MAYTRVGHRFRTDFRDMLRILENVLESSSQHDARKDIPSPMA